MARLDARFRGPVNHSEVGLGRVFRALALMDFRCKADARQHSAAGGLSRCSLFASLNGFGLVQAVSPADLAKGRSPSLILERSLPSHAGTESLRTRRWRKQSRANSSRKPQFPVIQGIYREFDQFRPCAPESEVEKMIIISGLEENSLRKGTAK
jgi:hypothetical protein